MRLPPSGPRRAPALAALAACLALGASACSEAGAVLFDGGVALRHDGVVAVRVSPGVGSVPFGGEAPLTAFATDVSGREIPMYAAEWSSADTSVVTVSPEGVVSGRAAGWTLVTATVNGLSGVAVVSVSGAPMPAEAVLVAAGDIASCGSQGDEATAALLDGVAGTVAPLGDNVYMSGTAEEFYECYTPSWGRHRARTRPAVGNHEYGSADAAPYFDYFGPAAGDRARGYYSYDLGAWHVVVLNSNCGEVSCAAGSAQERWLRADLAAHPSACTVAYWHHPRFNSGASHQGEPVEEALRPFWNALHEHGVELVLNGHEHVYERFAPQTPDGASDPERGVRQFTVGTGGKSPGRLGVREANSEVFEPGTYGLLKLTLRDGGYEWQFVPVAGGTFTDSGSAACH